MDMRFWVLNQTRHTAIIWRHHTVGGYEPAPTVAVKRPPLQKKYPPASVSVLRTWSCIAGVGAGIDDVLQIYSIHGGSRAPGELSPGLLPGGPGVSLGGRGELCPSDAMGEHLPGAALAQLDGSQICGSQSPEVARWARVSVPAAPPVRATAPSEFCASALPAIRTRMIAFRRPIAFDTIRSCGNTQRRAGLSSHPKAACNRDRPTPPRLHM